MKLNDIEKYIKEKGSISVPELQKEFSLDYKEARELIAEAEEKKLVRFDGTLHYLYTEQNADDKGEDEAAHDDSKERLRKLKNELDKLPPLYKKVVEYCSEHNFITPSLLRRNFPIGYSKAISIAEWLVKMGVVERNVPYGFTSNFSKKDYEGLEILSKVEDTFEKWFDNFVKDIKINDKDNDTDDADEEDDDADTDCADEEDDDADHEYDFVNHDDEDYDDAEDSDDDEDDADIDGFVDFDDIFNDEEDDEYDFVNDDEDDHEDEGEDDHEDEGGKKGDDNDKEEKPTATADKPAVDKDKNEDEDFNRYAVYVLNTRMSPDEARKNLVDKMKIFKTFSVDREEICKCLGEIPVLIFEKSNYFKAMMLANNLRKNGILAFGVKRCDNGSADGKDGYTHDFDFGCDLLLNWFASSPSAKTKDDAFAEATELLVNASNGLSVFALMLDKVRMKLSQMTDEEFAELRKKASE